jgi:protein involved in polysaccharide export with SLBB domain
MTKFKGKSMRCKAVFNVFAAMIVAASLTGCGTPKQRSAPQSEFIDSAVVQGAGDESPSIQPVNTLYVAEAAPRSRGLFNRAARSESVLAEASSELTPEELAVIDAEMARATAAAQVEIGSRVTLRPGLLLNIKVMVAGRNQLESDAVRITESSDIFLPMLGQVPVAGFTLERLREELTTRYQRFYVQPEVLVDFAREGMQEGISPWGFVTVLGRVKNPGRIMIPATRDLTVSGAIQGAGGFDRSARINAIRVTRHTPGGNGQEQFVVNLNEVGADGRARDDFVLGMNDIVFVPEARF